jgi:hypothetical protein
MSDPRTTHREQRTKEKSIQKGITDLIPWVIAFVVAALLSWLKSGGD